MGALLRVNKHQLVINMKLKRKNFLLKIRVSNFYFAMNQALYIFFIFSVLVNIKKNLIINLIQDK